MATYQNALGRAGAASGFGLGNLLGDAIGLLDKPRQWAWNAAGLEDGAQLVQEAGIDPESLAGRLIGHGAEMLFDPLNLISGGGLGLIGRGLGKGLDVASGIAKERTALKGMLGASAAEREALEKASRMAKGIQEAPNDLRNLPMPSSEAWKIPDDSMFLPTDMTKGLYESKVFNRVSPEAMQALQKAGMGIPRQGGIGGAVMTMGHTPPFVKGRGGVMHLDPTQFVPSIEPTFSPSRSLFQHLGDSAGDLGSRVGPDIMHAPMDEVVSLAARRMDELPDPGMIGSRLADLDATPTMFNLSDNPRLSEALAERLANMNVAGVGASLIPGLLAPQRRRPDPPRPEFEQLGVMPQEVRPPMRSPTFFEQTRY